MLIPTNGNTGLSSNNHNWYRTHCRNGHPFDEINTYIQPKSRKRLCRTCESERKRSQRNIDLEASRAKDREHMRQWRMTNKERDRRNWTELRKRKKEWLDSQKTVCIACGESDPACLDFHHRDSSKKDADLSVAVAHWSIRRLKIEMAKCDILCSNCHRKLHWKERNTLSESYVKEHD